MPVKFSETPCAVTRASPLLGQHTREILATLGYDDAAVDRLESRVIGSEKRHTGEIRICIEAGLPLSYLWRDASARERAVMMFGKLRVWDTDANNGVLIYVLLAEHAIEIVADRGVARVVPQAHWDGIVAGMREAFRAGRFEEGVNAAVDAVDARLAEHFPIAAGALNPNELPDRPVRR
jgi:uncharacterized membrane protein